ncbi:DgyrCDS2550 [Dimorphilus gyrociliatus]|uniref:DgyrCDS2550 n=1 Tax=Dimorphilus gyrociliatus TaxID=2664684 RepID=A0A7I8VDF9_9ANNE|nr:DgyrCDS2550 [Dimorphilus gyrociliatus]
MTSFFYGDTDSTERDVREKIKRTLIKERQSEYTTKSGIRVFCGTWNVNGQLPNEETYPLDAWLHLDEAADIYAIGFQELNLNVTAHIVNDPLKEGKWKKYIEDFFKNNRVTKNIKFEMVSSIKLVGILLIVYANKKLMSKITDVRQHSYATGIAGILGNKGGVAVGCKVYETSICFVNCHLAAHQEYFEERNKQFQYIYKRLELPPTKDSQYPETLLIDSYNTLFWLGDLNYRINESYEYVVELVDIDAENVYDTLRKSDQLYIQRKARNAFADFHEAEICFAPTYKYDPGTDRFDSSEKNRIPAYCDRVLYKSIAEINTHILSYNSHPALKLSDHKPVSCLASTEVSEIDEKAYKRVYKDVQSTLDLRENEMLPKCILSCQEIDFSTLVVGEEYKETLTLHNDGQSTFSYKFKDHLESKKCCPDWISIHPKTGDVPKGRKTEIEISVNVGYNHMTQFYEKYGKFYMEEVLILDLVKGSDKFITVKGELTPSAFGLSLDILCRMNFRAVALESERLKELKSEQLIIPVPKEIFLMVDTLTKCLSQKGLFPKEPSSKRMQDVRLAIDTCDKPLLDYIKTEDPQAISSMLFVFLESLPNPIIDESCYGNFIQGYQQFTLLKQVISNMREPNKSTFQYLIKFLALVVEKNSATVKELSQLFANCFLRKPKKLVLDISMAEEEKRKEKIIEYFIDKSRKREY